MIQNIIWIINSNMHGDNTRLIFLWVLNEPGIMQFAPIT